MKAIELLLRLAKIREDQAMATARKATGQVHQAEGFQKQVLDYAMDYENQILEGAKTGTSVAFIQDANAFREKLLLSSAEISNQIKGLSMNSDQALKIAMQAKMRSQGLGKLVAKAHLEARRKQARSEINQMEDNYLARLHGRSGTENA
jgi:flagellar biosynthesis chaperone FliJ